MQDPLASQIRRDPLTDETVLMACQRFGRPTEYQIAPPSPSTDFDCPFCPENEAVTPEPRFDYPAADASGSTTNGSKSSLKANGSHWTARVVPNRYPALKSEAGCHLVVIESARHVDSWLRLTHAERCQTLAAYQDQLRRSESRGFAYTQIFKNCGPESGASIVHSHSQILSTPFIPPRVQSKVDGAVEYYGRSGKCYFCDMLDHRCDEKHEQHAANEVFSSPHFAVVCPEYSRFPYETWVMPLQHQDRFEILDWDGVNDLANVLTRTVESLQSVLPNVAYNWMLHTAPHGAEAKDTYHWHLELIPRLAKLGGYELATGSYINLVNPREAAQWLSKELVHLDHSAQSVPNGKTS